MECQRLRIIGGFVRSVLRLSAFVIACCLTDTDEVRAQVVQLPSMQNFSYSGSVMVPDSGGADLAGMNRGLNRTTRYGGFPGLGGSRESSSLAGVVDAQARVWIIDHEAWDRIVLGATPQEFLRRRRQRERLAAAVAEANEARQISHQQSTARKLPQKSQAGGGDDPNALGKELVRSGREAAASGNIQWTHYYYKLAQLHLDQELAALAEKELQTQLEKLKTRSP